MFLGMTVNHLNKYLFNPTLLTSNDNQRIHKILKYL